MVLQKIQILVQPSSLLMKYHYNNSNNSKIQLEYFIV